MFLKTYLEGSLFAVLHYPMHEFIKPTLLNLLGADKIMFMIDKLLVGLDKRILCINEIYEIPVDSLRGSGKLSSFSFH